MTGRNEFTRTYDVRFLPVAPVTIFADEAERAALARRFALVRIERLEAEMTLEPVKGGGASAAGRLRAAWVQSCAVSAEDLSVEADEPIALRFVPAASGYRPDEEVELSDEDCDEIEFTAPQFDLGEAVAQSLALVIDPFLTGPDAEAARKAAGIMDEGAAGPFAALAALRKTD